MSRAALAPSATPPRLGRPTANLTGRRFGRLVVLGRAAIVSTRACWDCRCACGSGCVAAGSDLQRGHTTSCGCARRDAARTHGLSQRSEYRVWRGCGRSRSGSSAAGSAAGSAGASDLDTARAGDGRRRIQRERGDELEQEIERIRAKFRVQSVKRADYGQGSVSEEIVAGPVVGGSDENRSFSRATPSGELKLTITNPDAFGFFVAGAEIYLDVTPAPRAAEASN